MKTGAYMDLAKLRALIKSIEHHELQICITGEIFVYQPEEHGEKPDAPEETEPEIEKHRAPTPEEIEAMNLETEELPVEIVQAIEDRAEIEGPTDAEAIEIEEHRAPTQKEIEAMNLEDEELPVKIVLINEEGEGEPPEAVEEEKNLQEIPE